MRVFDCFSFFNELDLLELRLNELNGVVDKFVLVEATRTFTKKDKPLYYNDNKDRYKDFHHKIIHIIVDTYPTWWASLFHPSSWVYDTHQKNQAALGLKDCAPDDMIIFSDMDEIPNPQGILANKGKEGYFVFRQKHFYYFMNCVEVTKEGKDYVWWNGPVMTRYKDFTDVHKLRLKREMKDTDAQLVPNGGWHFAYLGGVEKIIQKIESYAHTEHNKSIFKDKERIQHIIESGQGLYGNDMKCRFEEMDASYPTYLINHKEKFAHLIKEI
jgi:beta-1,4-mannosyl-glycoprotein beta-1,4-N-acetylglucosaminyltransferase